MTTQANPMSPTIRHPTCRTRRAAPTPTTDDDTTWVVLTGAPKPDAAPITRALEPEPTMHAFVTELVDAGYLTGVVSNNVREWQDTWDRALPPAELFSAVVLSATVGVRKPNRDIYLMAVERLGVAPHEALFLDDFAPMAEGARAAGLHALHVEAHDVAIGEARALLDG